MLGMVCRIFRPSPRGSDSWQLEDIVYESRTAHITCLAWQPVAGSLPPMLLIGSSKGAEVNRNSRSESGSISRKIDTSCSRVRVNLTSIPSHHLSLFPSSCMQQPRLDTVILATKKREFIRFDAALDVQRRDHGMAANLHSSDCLR